MAEFNIGKGWAFPPHFSKVSRGVQMAESEKEIEDSLTILLSTSLGERLFSPDFGCDLEDFQFSSMNASAVARLKSMVEYAITQYEQRVTLDSVEVLQDEMNAGTLVLRLMYTINETEVQKDMVFTYIFE